MTQQNHIPVLRNIVGYTVLALLIFLALGLFATSYIGGLALLVGVVTYIFIFQILQFIIRDIKKPSSKIWDVLSLLVLIATLFLFIYFLTIFSNPAATLNPLPPPRCDIAYYHAFIETETSKIDCFKVQEFVALKKDASFAPPTNWIPELIDDQIGFRLPEKDAEANSRGFLLKEVVIDSTVTCSNKITIELKDFPRNSFYAAHYASDIQSYPYIDTETITWNSKTLNIQFAYIPPPFQIISPFLTPLIGTSSLSQWIIVLIGMTGASLFFPIIKTILIESTGKTIRNKIVGDYPKKQNKQRVKIIISERGDEKEIEVRKNNKAG